MERVIAIGTAIQKVRRMILCAGMTCVALPAHTHPHVFVDGGVDFRFDENARLTSLQVTWLYDAFETLYILSANGLSLNEQGGLDEPDRLTLETKLSEWPSDFDGSAHLTHNGALVPLAWPSDPAVQLVDGRLQTVFTRNLEAPMDLRGQKAEVAFYESTYFFAFKITNAPDFTGPSPCAAEVIPFSAETQDASLLAKLAQLSREEIPDDEDVGRLFADRIVLSCG